MPAGDAEVVVRIGTCELRQTVPEGVGSLVFQVPELGVLKVRWNEQLAGLGEHGEFNVHLRHQKRVGQLPRPSNSAYLEDLTEGFWRLTRVIHEDWHQGVGTGRSCSRMAAFPSISDVASAGGVSPGPSPAAREIGR